jgi:hypothetical protein
VEVDRGEDAADREGRKYNSSRQLPVVHV